MSNIIKAARIRDVSSDEGEKTEIRESIRVLHDDDENGAETEFDFDIESGSGEKPKVRTQEERFKEMIDPELRQRILAEELVTLRRRVENERVGIIEEAQATARRLISEAEEKGKAIVEDADQNAGMIVNESETVGYQQGYKKGLREGKEAKEAKLEECVDDIKELVQFIKDENRRTFTENEKQIVQLSFDIAKKIMRQQIKVDDDSIPKMLEEIIKENEKTVKVYLSEMNRVLKFRVDRRLYGKIKALSENLRVIAIKEEDEDEKRDVIRIETETGMIDASISSQIDALKEELGVSDDGEPSNSEKSRAMGAAGESAEKPAAAPSKPVDGPALEKKKSEKIPAKKENDEQKITTAGGETPNLSGLTDEEINAKAAAKLAAINNSRENTVEEAKALAKSKSASDERKTAGDTRSKEEIDAAIDAKNAARLVGQTRFSDFEGDVDEEVAAKAKEALADIARSDNAIEEAKKKARESAAGATPEPAPAPEEKPADEGNQKVMSQDEIAELLKKTREAAAEPAAEAAPAPAPEPEPAPAPEEKPSDAGSQKVMSQDEIAELLKKTREAAAEPAAEAAPAPAPEPEPAPVPEEKPADAGSQKVMSQDEIAELLKKTREAAAEPAADAAPEPDADAEAKAKAKAKREAEREAEEAKLLAEAAAAAAAAATSYDE
ncbi:MAG: hypothetical protein K6F52_04180 [Clostridia bacterium]|nr:hypothetical protein [Clostridia bacterium]